jgi:hypothetical protein
VPGAGVEVPATRRSTEEAAHAAEALARTAEASDCCSGDAGRRHSVRRALEEEKVGLLHLEVRSRFSRRSGFEGVELKLLSPC